MDVEVTDGTTLALRYRNFTLARDLLSDDRTTTIAHMRSGREVARRFRSDAPEGCNAEALARVGDALARVRNVCMATEPPPRGDWVASWRGCDITPTGRQCLRIYAGDHRAPRYPARFGLALWVAARHRIDSDGELYTPDEAEERVHALADEVEALDAEALTG